MRKKEVLKLSKQYLAKIIEHYGESKFQQTTPYLSIESRKYSDVKDPHIKGEYCRVLNEIVVYWKNIETVEELTKTVIHEYIHYLQSPTWMTRYYSMGYEYQTHPYELQAYKEEQNWKIINRVCNIV